MLQKVEHPVVLAEVAGTGLLLQVLQVLLPVEMETLPQQALLKVIMVAPVVKLHLMITWQQAAAVDTLL